MKHRFIFFVVVLMTLTIPNIVKAYSFSAVAPSGQTLYYNINNSEVTLTYPSSSWENPWLGYEKPTGELVIPSSVTYNGVTYPVTSIYHGAFLGCTGLTSVCVPNSVTDMGNLVFNGCTGLTSIVLSEFITRISTCTFENCINLTSITLSSQLQSIEASAFYGCSSLASITLPNSITSIKNNAFYGCSSLTSITIPESLTTRGSAIFYGCSSLTTVTYNAVYISGGNTEMFSSCPNLTTVVFGNHVSVIPAFIFSNCTGITEITLPSSVTTIQGSAFSGCIALTSINIPEGVSEIGSSTFEGCTSLSSITLPESLTQIGQAAFRQCTSLTSLAMENVTQIGANAFAGCNSLSIQLSNAVYSIGSSAFLNVPTVYYCGTATGSPWGALSVVPCYTEDSLIYLDNTKTVLTGADANIRVASIPSSVVRIDARAFLSHSQLVSVTIPSSVTKIGAQAFQGCVALSDINIPDSITNIKKQTFYACHSLQSVILPPRLRSIEEKAFFNCGLTSIILPDSVEIIGEEAFESCGQLTAVTIPESVTQIGKSVFSGSGVRTIYFNAKEVMTNYYSTHYIDGSSQVTNFFTGDDSLQTIILGDSVKRIPAGFFGHLNQVGSLTHVVLPTGVKYIGDEAFLGCTQMVDITIPESVDTLGRKIFNGCLALKKVNFNATHAVSTPSTNNAAVPILAYRGYTCGTLSTCGTASSPVTRILAEHLPAYDTIIIGQNVENIPDYAFGLVYEDNFDGRRQYTLDSLSYLANTKVINNSTKLRHIGAGAFGNMRVHEFDFRDSLKTIDMCAFIGNPIKKVFLPEGTTIVADGAFNNCHSLDSVSLPSTLQKLGSDCFASTTSLRYLYYDCEDAYTYSFSEQASYSNSPFCATPSLNQVTFGPHVRNLNANLFSNANGIQRIVIPEGVEYIENDLFKMWYTSAGTPAYSGYYPDKVDGSNLSYVELPASLISIGLNAFGQVHIDTIVCRGSNPAYIGSVFESNTKNYSVLKVPCGSSSAYSTSDEWMDFTNITEFMPYDVSLTVNIDTMGTVASVCTGTQSGGHPGVRLTATPAADHRFVQWSDGVTTNPRTIYLSQDTAFEAQFAWGVLYQITAHSSNNNRGSVTGSGTFVQNSIDTLVATPNYGYHFTQWNDGDTTNPRYLTVTATQTLTATFQPNQYSLAVHSADSTQGSVSGGGTYNYYTIHSITATPTTGYHFAGWSDGVSSNPRSVRVTQDTSFTAQFAINIYSLTVSSANATMGSAAADSTQYPHGATATLTATPNYGYHFSQWNDGDTTNPRLYTMTQNKTFSAQFAPNQYTVTLATDTVRGSIAGGGTYSYLSNTTLTATPYYGYYFSSWSDGDTNNPRYLSVTSDTSLSALFSKSVFHVTVSTNVSWQGSAQVSNEYPEYLDTVTLTAIPNYGYHFAWWSDGQADSTDNPRQVVVTGNKNVCAIFLTNQYSLTLDVDTNIHGSVSGAGLYDYYAERTIFATPSYGYHFSAWSDGDTNNPRIITLTQDTSFTALFLPNQYTLEVLSSDTDLGQTYGSGTYNYLDTVPFGVTAIAPHYHFTHWNDGTTDSAGLIVIYGDQTLVASFVIDTHTVSVVANDDSYGAVFGEGSYPYGSQVSLTATANYGYYFVRWNNGETDNPYTLNIYGDTSITAIFAPELNADLCMVSVEEGYNTLIWNGEPTAVSYQVLRESSTAGQYELLDLLDAHNNHSWVDTSSRPASRSYRYRLRAIDEWGSSFEGQPHKTMHLTINRGVGSNWNLVWTEYEGTQFVTYIIYRGSNPSNIEEIDRIPVGGNTTYTDENAPNGELYYQVGIVPALPCNNEKSGGIILSNIANSSTEGIEAVVREGVMVYPNPTTGLLTINAEDVLSVEVFDPTGRKVATHERTNNIDLAKFPAGAYLLKIHLPNGTSLQRVILK